MKHEIDLLTAKLALMRMDRDCEKRLRKDAESRLADAVELLLSISRGEVNPEDEAIKWLKVNDPSLLIASRNDTESVATPPLKSTNPRESRRPAFAGAQARAEGWASRSNSK